MKAMKIIFWTTMVLLSIWLGIGPIFAYDDPTSVKVITHLGYPVYFCLMLTCFKVTGILAIIIPQIPARIKEWAYAGFAIDLTCATIGFITVDGFIAEVFLPITCFTILITNYYSYNKIQQANA